MSHTGARAPGHSCLEVLPRQAPGEDFPWGQGHTGQATGQATAVKPQLLTGWRVAQHISGEGQGGEEDSKSRWAVTDEESHLGLPTPVYFRAGFLLRHPLTPTSVERA